MYYPTSEHLNLGQVNTPYGRVHVMAGRYPHGGAIAVHLVAVGPIPEPMGVLSVNLHPQGVRLADDEFCVKDWNENERLIPAMLDSGLFQPAGRVVPTGYVLSPVWRIRNPEHVPPVR